MKSVKERLGDLHSSYTAKQTERDKLLEKDTLEAADVAGIETLNGELKTMQATAKTLKETLETDAWEDGDDRLPMWGAGKDSEIGGGVVTTDPETGATHGIPLGMKFMGDYTDLEFNKALRDVHHRGPAALGAKTWSHLKTRGYKSAFDRYLRNGENVGATAAKDLSEGLDPQGGYLVPPEFLARIVERKPTPTGLMDKVMRIPTSRDAVMMPTVNFSDPNDIYTTPFLAQWTSENPTTAAGQLTAQLNDSNLFGTVRINVFTAMMAIPISRNLLEDSAFDVQAYVQSKLSETYRLTIDNVIINGTGINQPEGILAAPGTANKPRIVKSGTANTITPDSVINLSEAIPAQYDDNAMYLLHKQKTRSVIRTFKDSANRYLFTNGDGYPDTGIRAGSASLINGYGYMMSSFMPGPGANQYPLICGDFSGYYLAERLGLTIEVLREIRAMNNQIVLLARFRVGGMPVEWWKLFVQQCTT